MIYKIKHIYKKWIMCHSSVCSKPVSSLPSPTKCPLRMNQLNEPLNDEPVNFAAWRLLPWYNWLTKQFAGNCRILHFLRSCKCACFLKVMQGFISRISFGRRHHKLLTMFTFLHAVRALEKKLPLLKGKTGRSWSLLLTLVISTAGRASASFFTSASLLSGTKSSRTVLTAPLGTISCTFTERGGWKPVTDALQQIWDTRMWSTEEYSHGLDLDQFLFGKDKCRSPSC